MVSDNLCNREAEAVYQLFVRNVYLLSLLVPLCAHKVAKI